MTGRTLSQNPRKRGRSHQTPSVVKHRTLHIIIMGKVLNRANHGLSRSKPLHIIVAGDNHWKHEQCQRRQILQDQTSIRKQTLSWKTSCSILWIQNNPVNYRDYIEVRSKKGVGITGYTLTSVFKYTLTGVFKYTLTSVLKYTLTSVFKFRSLYTTAGTYTKKNLDPHVACPWGGHYL